MFPDSRMWEQRTTCSLCPRNNREGPKQNLPCQSPKTWTSSWLSSPKVTAGQPAPADCSNGFVFKSKPRFPAPWSITTLDSSEPSVEVMSLLYLTRNDVEEAEVLRFLPQVFSHSLHQLISFLVWRANTRNKVPAINVLWPLDVAVFYGLPDKSNTCVAAISLP